MLLVEFKKIEYKKFDLKKIDFWKKLISANSAGPAVWAAVANIQT